MICVCAQIRKDGHMEENAQKFLEKMNELVALGKKKKSILDVQEINDFFADMELSAEQMEKVFEYLEGHNIDVLRITADTDDDVDIDNMIAEEEEVDMENIDLSVPEGVSIEDPVRMYLKEIGKVPLLSAERHITRAKICSVQYKGGVSMLLNLHVKNLAIIDEIEVEFSEGLNVLTGETGAGKSIIIGSINIALGGKVSKDIIRTGTEFALVELTFLAEDSEQINSLEKLGITLEEDVVVISRKITKCRTINRVNGETVSVSMLKSIADILIDIHGQNEQQSLLYKNKHMEIVDRYAAEKMCGRDMEFSEMYRQYKDMLVKYSEKEMSEEERLREVSFIRYELEQIEQAHLVKGEEEKLQERYRYLSNANEIKSGINEVYSLVEDSYGDSQSVSQMLGRSSHILAKISGYDERLKELARQIADIDELIMDFNRDLQEYASDMDENGEEFAEVETRLDLVRTIKSKYGATTELVENYAKDLENKLEKYEAYEEYRANLEKKIEIYKIKLEKLGESISKIRKKCSAELEKRITDALIDLNFLQVKFEIAVRELDEFNSKGKDEVEFMISTNPGEDLKPIGQAASGGELSRIMLAIKAVLAEHDSIGTLIFDEIDVGISGRTAQKVAEKMAFIGHSHQVICISHLAQIAAMADHNYLIEKNNSLNKTSTVIRQLEGDEIVEEIARILGGAKITDAVLESAREMKQLADIEKINYKKVSRPA